MFVPSICQICQKRHCPRRVCSRWLFHTSFSRPSVLAWTRFSRAPSCHRPCRWRVPCSPPCGRGRKCVSGGGRRSTSYKYFLPRRWNHKFSHDFPRRELNERAKIKDKSNDKARCNDKVRGMSCWECLLYLYLGPRRNAPCKSSRPLSRERTPHRLSPRTRCSTNPATTRVRVSPSATQKARTAATHNQNVLPTWTSSN